MTARFATGLIGWLACGALCSGCKDDPPPPPLPTPESASAARKDKPVETTAAQIPAYTDETTKRFRVELCYYGAFGLQVTRDAYLASLGGKEPSEQRLPQFGEFPENAPTAGAATASAAAALGSAPVSSATTGARPKATALAQASGTAGARAGDPPMPLGRPDPNALAQRLPYTRYISSCALANRKEGDNSSDEAIDKAIAEFEPWASALNRNITAAQRYFATKQFEKDKFERGKSSHAELMKAFGELDQKFAAFTTAFQSWEATLGKPKEQLDKAAELAWSGLDKARALGALAVAETIDAEAWKKAREELVQAKDALEAEGKQNGKAPHPRELAGVFRKLSDAASEAERALKNQKLPTANRYLVTTAVASLVESNHRALGQHLRLTGQTKASSPLTTLRPRLDAANPGRPDLPARGTRPKVPTAPTEPEQPE